LEGYSVSDLMTIIRIDLELELKLELEFGVGTYGRMEIESVL
jgi:hypothetical protein